MKYTKLDDVRYQDKPKRAEMEIYSQICWTIMKDTRINYVRYISSKKRTDNVEIVPRLLGDNEKHRTISSKSWLNATDFMTNLTFQCISFSVRPLGQPFLDQLNFIFCTKTHVQVQFQYQGYGVNVMVKQAKCHISHEFWMWLSTIEATQKAKFISRSRPRLQCHMKQIYNNWIFLFANYQLHLLIIDNGGWYVVKKQLGGWSHDFKFNLDSNKNRMFLILKFLTSTFWMGLCVEV